MIPDVINNICNVIRVVTKATDIYVDVADVITDSNMRELKIAASLSKAAILTLDILGIIGNSGGKFSDRALLGLKTGETFVRLADLPLNFANTWVKLGDKISTPHGIIRLIERGAIVPLAGIGRCVCEMDYLSEKLYLADFKKDPNAERPIYEVDSEGDSKIVGYRPIDPKECEERMKLFKDVGDVLNVTEAVASLSPIETAYRLYIGRILNRLGPGQGPQPPPNGPQLNVPQLNVPQLNVPQLNVPQPNVQPPQPQNNAPQPQNGLQFNGSQPNAQPIDISHMVDIDACLKFSKMKAIPMEFYPDPIFKKYVCAITHIPIRHIVQDSTTGNAENPTYYEKEVIKVWLKKHHTSPCTRKPLTMKTLTKRPDIQKIINMRLEFYELDIVKHIFETEEKEEQRIEEEKNGKKIEIKEVKDLKKDEKTTKEKEVTVQRMEREDSDENKDRNQVKSSKEEED